MVRRSCQKLGNQAYDMLIPPAIPRAGLFLFKAFASGGQNARIVPPSSMHKEVGFLEVSDGRGVPKLGVWERAGEH
jgi:hypothetical protein